VRGLIINHASEHTRKPKDVIVTAMEVSYRDFVAGMVTANFFAIIVFILGFHAK